MVPLMQSHFNEISPHSEFEFNLKRKIYIDLEAVGKAKLFAVFSNKVMIGYSVYFIQTHNHVDILQAHQDAIYLDPSYRGIGVGEALITFADISLKAMGVQMVFVSVSDKLDYSKTLIPLGYKSIERLYARRL